MLPDTAHDETCASACMTRRTPASRPSTPTFRASTQASAPSRTSCASRAQASPESVRFPVRSCHHRRYRISQDNQSRKRYRYTALPDSVIGRPVLFCPIEGHRPLFSHRQYRLFHSRLSFRFRFWGFRLTTHSAPKPPIVHYRLFSKSYQYITVQ